jgi:MraZ protein
MGSDARPPPPASRRFVDAHIAPCYPKPSQQRRCNQARFCRLPWRRVLIGEGPLFLSLFPRALDAKGRLSLPAPFRAYLGREGFEGVFIHPALDAPALDCGGQRLLGSIEGLLGSMPAYSPEREDLSLALLGAGEIAKLDPEGRLSLSERLKSHIGLMREAVIVGQGEKFQIWAPERFAAHLDQARSRARELRLKLARAPA